MTTDNDDAHKLHTEGRAQLTEWISKWNSWKGTRGLDELLAAAASLHCLTGSLSVGQNSSPG